MSRTRVVLFGLTLGLYTAIVSAVLLTTELVRLDWQVMLFRPYKQWPQFHAMLDYFVVMGQRGPTAVLVAAWLGWRSWRHCTLRPLLVLATALLLLNVSVGAVKIGLGRLGPHYATTVGSAELFAGGDIFPSGHTANAVVTWGVLAYLATTARARRVLSLIAAAFALGVGATTVYIGTHWLSDVLLGWSAGLLIMLALPWFEPFIARAEVELLTRWARLRTRRSGAGRPERTPVAEPVPTRTGATVEEPDAAPSPAEERAARSAHPHHSAVGGVPGTHAAGGGTPHGAVATTRLSHAFRIYPLRTDRASLPTAGHTTGHATGHGAQRATSRTARTKR